jgi:hypothetical protein
MSLDHSQIQTGAEHKNVRAYGWVFTWNNPTFDETEMERLLHSTNAQSFAFQHETGKECGTPHYQGVVQYKEKKYRNSLKKQLPGVSYIERRTAQPQAAWSYATKEDSRTEGHTPVMFGIPPRNKDNKGGVHDEIAKLETVMQAGRKRDYKTMINAGVKTQHINQIIKATDAYDMYHNKPEDGTECKGVWIRGPPGTGKSHLARAMSTSTYGEAPFTINPNGKEWFDGYQGEKVIHIEDLDQNGRSYGTSIKQWADKWACQAEIKGGHTWLRHQVLIVTSNYTPEEIFGADDEKQSSRQKSNSSKLAEAVRDRFLFVNTTGMPKRRADDK